MLMFYSEKGNNSIDYENTFNYTEFENFPQKEETKIQEASTILVTIMHWTFYV